MNPGGLRMTRQRRIILEELGKVTSHPTASDLYQRVRRRLPRISLATVYRNLEILSACGAITKLEAGGTQKRFDGDTSLHYHVRCMACGRVDDLPVKPIGDIEKYLRGTGGYEIVGHRLEFVGFCPKCKAKRHKKVSRVHRRSR